MALRILVVLIDLTRPARTPLRRSAGRHHIGREPVDIFVDAVGKRTADIQARLGDLIAGRLNQTIVRFSRGTISLP